VKVEREVKIRFPDAAAARAAVTAAGAERVRERHLEDNLLLDDAAASLAGGRQALRLRRTEGRAVLTFKVCPEVDASGQKARPETETDVSDPDAAQSILLSLGWAPSFRYQKYREVWEWRDVEIVVDETPVGVFVEIEGDAAAIDEAARALGCGRDAYVNASYPDLFRAQGGRGDMVF
jgi:adenylate cyclase, class 2